VRTIPMAVVAGLLAAVLAGQPADAYVRKGGTATASQTVTAGQPLTVSGTTAVCASSAKACDAVAVTATITNPTPSTAGRTASRRRSPPPASRAAAPPTTRVNGSPKSVAGGGRTLAVTGLTVTLVTGNCKGSTVTLAYLAA